MALSTASIECSDEVWSSAILSGVFITEIRGWNLMRTHPA